MSDLPDGWRLSVLSDIAIERGLQTGPFGSQLKASEYSENGIPVVMPSDLADYRISTNSIARIPVERAREMGKHQLQAGDIIFGRRGDIGRCAMVTENEEGWICGTGCLRVRLSLKKALPEFVIQYLDLPQAIGWLQSNAVGQTMLNLNTTILSELPLYLPPLAEQRKIAEILSSWDEAIQLVEALIAALKERKRGLMQRLLTGEVRFPGFDEAWEEVRLGDVFTERNETGFGQLPLVAITMGKGIMWRDDLDRRDTSSADKSNYLRICPGDIGYNTMRMWQGVSDVSEIEGIVSPAYTICIPHEDIDVNFMGYLFKLTETIHTFWRYSQGLVKDTLALKFNNFSEIKLRIPAAKIEQSKIAEALKCLDDQIDELALYTIQFREQKKGLMQRLLTGEVRVDVSDDV